MSSRLLRTARLGLFLITTLSAGITIATGVQAAPYAAMVVDAKTGAVIHEENADTRLHPASLTKMMTLYIAFQAIQRGEISLDSQITIPSAAAAHLVLCLGRNIICNDIQNNTSIVGVFSGDFESCGASWGFF